MRHILGNKVLQYDVDDRGVIVDEREIDRDDMSKPVDVYNAKLVNITQDGTYDIPPLETVNGNLSFRNGSIVGACNITITQLPLRQQ